MFISVVVPAYNEEKYITKCLTSLKSQNFQQENYEIIVECSGSQDKTKEIALSFGAKVVDVGKIEGVSWARQRGGSESRGDTIAYTDADTVLPPNWLSGIAKAMADTDVVCVGGMVKPLGRSILVSFVFVVYYWFLRLNKIFGKALLWGSNLAVRKDAFEEVGGFNVELLTSEDWDLALRLQKRFGKGAVVYNPNLRVYTSTRKQKNLPVFLRYFLSGVISYINVVILGKPRAGKMIVVR
jgi:cellulose synthase/poly-beta-1,6-N-acetylglucosamine synthase-like glycosyltransferase